MPHDRLASFIICIADSSSKPDAKLPNAISAIGGKSPLYIAWLYPCTYHAENPRVAPFSACDNDFDSDFIMWSLLVSDSK